MQGNSGPFVTYSKGYDRNGNMLSVSWQQGVSGYKITGMPSVTAGYIPDSLGHSNVGSLLACKVFCEWEQHKPNTNDSWFHFNGVPLPHWLHTPLHCILINTRQHQTKPCFTGYRFMTRFLNLVLKQLVSATP